MFCKKILIRDTGKYRKPNDEPNLINKLYKHRTLGELIALSKQTGVPPMPTRNGVYTGDQPIPRDRFDREDSLREMNMQLSELELQLDEAKKADALQAKQRELADMREQVKKELQQTAGQLSD